MKEEDRVVLLFLGWGIMMFVVVAMYCSITYKLEQISRRVDQMGEKLRIEMKHPKQATETDATETDATPAEPEKVSMEIREEFREPKKIATPSDAIKAEKLREEVREKGRQETAKQPVGTYELTAYIATGSPCADGAMPSVGYTVASNDPRLWHKTIEIEGYGRYYVHDTGGMASNVLDVFVGSYAEAIQFGRRTAKVYIVE